MVKSLLSVFGMIALLLVSWSSACGPEKLDSENPTVDGSITDQKDAGATTKEEPAKEVTPKEEPAKEVTPKETSSKEETPKGPTKLADLKPGQWNMIYPPKDAGTICSRGSEYAFFVYPGKINKVVIDFEGGGACWDAKSCSLADALFKDSIDNLKKLLETGYDKGIYDRANPKNPFKDWHHVYVPYCTGDIHWGDNIKTYKPKSGKPITINHKGAVNARAVLAWTYKNIVKPEKVFVTGCSAGSYGSLIWSAHIAKQYKDAKLYQFGDSGSGVITDNFLKNSFPSWKAEQAAPSWVPGLDPSKVKIAEQDLPYMYNKIAAHYSSHLFSQYNTAFDKTQVLFFRAMGGGKNPQEWSTKMRASVKKILDASKNFRSYIPAGDRHCIIPYAQFYTYEVDGIKLVDWMTDMVSDKEVKNLSCKGDGCNPPKP